MMIYLFGYIFMAGVITGALIVAIITLMGN